MSEKQGSGGVLVVDDEDEILELLEEYLKVRGYRPWTARNGREALDTLEVEPIDVVLTDMKMPGLGGLELMEAVAEMSRPIAVVMMTGFGTVETAIHAMKLGAADYVLKPFKLRDIHRALSSAHERVEAIRARRQDTALRHFYEHCHRVHTLDDIQLLEQELVDMLVRRLDLVAAGVCAAGEGSAVWASSNGDPVALEQMLSLEGLDEAQKNMQRSMSIGTSGMESRRLVVQLGATNGDESGIESILGALCTAMVCVRQRVHGT